MNHAQQISGPVAADDPQAWLAGVLRERFDEVIKHREAALDPAQTEGVHEMRVAVRRLRSVIRDFAEISEKFSLPPLRKILKRLAESLGAVRDTDVLLNVLEKLSQRTNDAQVHEGLAAIAAHYREKRALAFLGLEKTLSEKYTADLRERFDAALDTSIRQRDLFEVSSVRDAASQIISKCTVHLVDRAEAIYYPSSAKRLHRLRIAGKHLRYALELFQPVFGDYLVPFAEQTRDMQTHLGDVHDCDVWIAEIRNHLVKGKHRDPANIPTHTAAAWLISEFTRLRTKAYRSALELWTTWETDRFAHKLTELIVQHL